jgi:DNA topoisomerase I
LDALIRAQHIVNSGARAHWWRRVGAPRRFRYVTEAGEPIRKLDEISRIRHLAIPPAWKEVRISPSKRSRLQVLGIDGGGKLQYLYHPSFVAHRQQHKFDRIEHFAEFLPRLRQTTSEHLAQDGLTKHRVLATIVRVINRLYFRVGSEAGVKKYRTYGVTTLRPHHLVFLDDGHVGFRFHGKHHIPTRRILVDETLERVLRELKARGGKKLFVYRNGDGKDHFLRGADVNEYIKDVTAANFSAKDFRTWAGTLLVAQELTKIGPAETERQRTRNINEAIQRAAAQLGNTPAVCRRAYLHPAVLELYNRGFTLGHLPPHDPVIVSQQSRLQPEEQALLELFHVARALRARRAPKRTPKPAMAPPPGALATLPGAPEMPA